MIEGKSTFKLNIPSDVEAKIRHICNVIHDVEWSGVLFYSYSGSMDDGSFEITCEDIYVMDIGSGAYTEYDEHPSILEYRIANNLLNEDIQEGLIHSHNNMSTFFSGTDTTTLNEEGGNSNHFVSLIVNNAGNYTARVTRKVTKELKAVAHIKYNSNVYYNSFGDTKVVLEENNNWEEDKEESKTIQEIEYFNLEINKEEAISPFQEIDERLREIKAEKKAKTSLITTGTRRYDGKANKYFPNYNKTKYPNEKPKSYWEQKEIFPEKNYGGYDDFYDDYYDYKYSHQYNRGSYEDYLNDTSFKNNKEEEEELPLCLTHDATPSLIESLAAQLLTGDVTTDPKDVKLNEFVTNMDYFYEEKFGPLVEEDYPNVSSEIIGKNNEKLGNWITSIVDFIVYSEDKELLASLKKEYGREFTEVDTAEVIAMDLWRYLDKLPESYVKDEMMEMLLNYIPDGAKEYFGDLTNE